MQVLLRGVNMYVDAEEERLPSEDETIESVNDENADEQTVPPTRPAARNSSEMVSTDFDQNQCYVCFRTYKEDVLEKTEFNWIKCECDI